MQESDSRPDEGNMSMQDSILSSLDDPSVDNYVQLGDFVQVVDKASNEVIIQGTVKYEKVNGPSKSSDRINELSGNKRLMSIDNKYFFKLDDDAYFVNKIHPFYINDNFIRQNYHLNTWKNYNGEPRDAVRMWIENPITDLDKEVKGAVLALNRFSPYMSTTTSCSGHDVTSAFIRVRFENESTLTDFLNVFEPFKWKMDISTEDKSYTHKMQFLDRPFFPRHIELCLRTKGIGEEAYKTLEEFDEYLSRVIDFRNKTYESLENMIDQETLKQHTRKA